MNSRKFYVSVILTVIVLVVLVSLSLSPSYNQLSIETKENKNIMSPKSNSKEDIKQQRIRFSDISEISNITARKFLSWGNPTVVDFDNDGYQDIVIQAHYNAPAFYRNNGDGTFSDILDKTNIPLRSSKGTNIDRHGFAWGDYNNDGVLDLYITQGACKGTCAGEKRDELFANDGTGSFLDITDTTGATNSLGRGRSAYWVDYNNDGFLDLFVLNLQSPSVLYHNNGDGTFADVTGQAGLQHVGGWNNSWADYDGDGYMDLLVSGSKIMLFKNNGDGTFTDVTTISGLKGNTTGRGIAWGDYNNDGYIDIFVTRENKDRPNMLFKNNGDGTFTDVTKEANVARKGSHKTAIWGDYNNDGWLDLYIVDIGNISGQIQPNLLYHNNGDGTFTNVAKQVGVAADNISGIHGTAAWGDLNNDGFLDLILKNGDGIRSTLAKGPVIIYKNHGNDNHWLEIKLVGQASNRLAIGASVIIETNDRMQYRQLNGGGGGELFSQGYAPLHFGLGSSTTIDSITIKWPSGLIQQIVNVPADQLITIYEPIED